MALIPDETIQKVLISTTSHLVGAFESDGVAIALAWPGRDDPHMTRWSEGPLSRTALVFTFETQPTLKEPGAFIPDYSPDGDVACSRLAVLFGKRFDNHGAFENHGCFGVPDMAAFTESCDPHIPQNSHTPRTDFTVPLNLSEVSRIRQLVIGGTLDGRFQASYDAAARFYLRALQSAERDPEGAYLNLITAGEIVSNWHHYVERDLLDDVIRSCLTVIRDNCPEGERIEKCIVSQPHQTKRKFVETLVRLCDNTLFERREVVNNFPEFRVSSFRKSIAAAYDLRSRYVHTGTPFDKWVGPQWIRYETQFGKPVTGDRKLDKVLAEAPTYLGLERIMRCTLLRFAEMNGAYVAPESSQDLKGN